MTVNLNTGVGDAADTGSSGDNTLISIENVMGSRFSDTITGDSGNNRINGMMGADIMTGGAGADVFVFTDEFSSKSLDPSEYEDPDIIKDFAFTEGDRLNFAGAYGEIAENISASDFSWRTFTNDPDVGTGTLLTLVILSGPNQNTIYNNQVYLENVLLSSNSELDSWIL